MTATTVTADMLAVPAFNRDRFTWLTYFLVSFYAFNLSSFGPAMPFLRDDLNLSYTVAGYHLSAFAAAMIFLGFLGDAPTRWLGRRRMIWLGGAGLALGVLILLAGQHPALTVLGAFVMGIFGSLMLSSVNATLVEYHGERRAIPITESNIAASLSSSIAPILIGTAAAIGLGWRAGLLVMLIAFAGVALFGRSIAVPAPTSAPPSANAKRTSSRERLPLAFWSYWLVMLFGVSVEGGLIFWGAEYLVGAVGMTNESASASMSAFFIASLVGRIGGSVFARWFASGRLLLGAALITLAGFPLFWLGQSAPVNLLGLFIAGVGVSNLFPLTMAAATTAAPRQPDAATARLFIGSGLALLLTPQILAAIADQMDIQRAYGFVGALAVGVVLIILVANTLAARRNLVTQ